MAGINLPCQETFIGDDVVNRGLSVLDLRLATCDYMRDFVENLNSKANIEDFWLYWRGSRPLSSLPGLFERQHHSLGALQADLPTLIARGGLTIILQSLRGTGRSHVPVFKIVLLEHFTTGHNEISSRGTIVMCLGQTSPPVHTKISTVSRGPAEDETLSKC